MFNILTFAKTPKFENEPDIIHDNSLADEIVPLTIYKKINHDLNKIDLQSYMEMFHLKDKHNVIDSKDYDEIIISSNLNGQNHSWIQLKNVIYVLISSPLNEIHFFDKIEYDSNEKILLIYQNNDAKWVIITKESLKRNITDSPLYLFPIIDNIDDIKYDYHRRHIYIISENNPYIIVHNINIYSLSRDRLTWRILKSSENKFKFDKQILHMIINNGITFFIYEENNELTSIAMKHATSIQKDDDPHVHIYKQKIDLCLIGPYISMKSAKNI